MRQASNRVSWGGVGEVLSSVARDWWDFVAQYWAFFSCRAELRPLHLEGLEMVLTAVWAVGMDTCAPQRTYTTQIRFFVTALKFLLVHTKIPQESDPLTKTAGYYLKGCIEQSGIEECVSGGWAEVKSSHLW